MRTRIIALIFALLPHWALAQGIATLVADHIQLEAGNRLIATGNVEVLYDGQRLIATSVIYDQSIDRLSIQGPIVIQTAEGDLLTANQAEFDPKLRNGLLRGARLVLDQQLQLAANQIDQVDGRYSQLYKTAVTSCQICGDRPPLWEIRAERVVHDQQEQQLYFDNATFRIRGVPVFWLPRARLPDPTLTRATGFLIPSLRTTDQLGTGIKIPYFITIGDHRDLTVTPYWSPITRTIETRYRQAFANGSIQIDATVTRDDLVANQLRGRLFADGDFDLGRDFQLKFDVETTTDRAYLLDYGYSSKDRLDSGIELTRVRENDLFVANITHYQSLRDGESNATLPPIVADVRFENRTNVLGGVGSIAASADTVLRYGNSGTEVGRDVARIGIATKWEDSWVSDFGLIAHAQLDLGADLYFTDDDNTIAEQQNRAHGQWGLELRYPLFKNVGNSTHILEPVIALAGSETAGAAPVNEDSTRPELDLGNLFALSRFAGDDALETGLRAAFGLNWSTTGANGSKANLTFGRAFSAVENPAFNEGSGLSGRASDWIIAGQFQLQEGLRFEGRSLLNEQLSPTLAAARLDWETERLSLAANYLWQDSDADINTPKFSEWSFDTEYRINDVWKVSFDTRYDLIADQPSRAALGIEWRNECVTANLSVSRRFTSSTNVEPSTDFGLSVALNGFSAGQSNNRPIASCTN